MLKLFQWISGTKFFRNPGITTGSLQVLRRTHQVRIWLWQGTSTGIGTGCAVAIQGVQQLDPILGGNLPGVDHFQDLQAFLFIHVVDPLAF
jgi:hypothetical protein